MRLKLKKRAYEILEVAHPGDRASRVFDIFILSLIAANVAALILESVESIRSKGPSLFQWFEAVSVAIFTLEYVLRVWSCTSSPEHAAPVKGRLRFMLTPLALIDLFAVLPFYLPFTGIDLRFIRAVRLVRLFRVMKVARYSNAVRTLGRVLKAKKEELAVTVFVLLLLLLFASTIMYHAEREAQPEHFGSIPASMWWAVATLTTVGYGDVYPVTSVGKAIASVIAILGIGMFALPTGILGAGFVEEVQSKKRQPIVCPRCGHEIRDAPVGESAHPSAS